MYQYFISAHFKKQLKVHLRKNRSILNDVIVVLRSFEKNRTIPLGANTYKLRFTASDLPKGKSHAFRMIILVVTYDALITPIALYFKGDRTDISKQEIMHHAEIIRQEIEQNMSTM